MSEMLMHTKRADQLVSWWRALSVPTQELLVAEYILGLDLRNPTETQVELLTAHEGWVLCSRQRYTTDPRLAAYIRDTMAAEFGYNSTDGFMLPGRFRISFTKGDRQYSLAALLRHYSDSPSLVALTALAVVLDERGVLGEWISRPLESEV